MVGVIHRHDRWSTREAAKSYRSDRIVRMAMQDHDVDLQRCFGKTLCSFEQGRCVGA
jgi:hypothetical protein